MQRLSFLFVCLTLIMSGCSRNLTLLDSSPQDVANDGVQEIDSDTAMDSDDSIESMPRSDDNADEETIDTSDWLTYTNEEYGFTIRYPNDWIYFNQMNEHTGAKTYIQNTNASMIRFTSHNNLMTHERAFSEIVVNIVPASTSEETLRKLYSSTTDEAPMTVLINGNNAFVFSANWPNEYEVKIFAAMVRSLHMK